MNKSELNDKIKSIKRKLDELKRYKVILAEEGQKPDRDDKERESELIKQLLRLEKIQDERAGKVVKKKPMPTPRDPKKRASRRDRGVKKPAPLLPRRPKRVKDK